MNKVLSFIKRFLHVVFILTAVLGVALYVTIHFDLADGLAKEKIEEALEKKLQTQVSIGSVEINWLNQAALNDVLIYDQNNDTLLQTRRVMAAFEFWPLLHQELVLNTVQFIDFDLSLKASPDGDSNFKFVIEALAPREDDRKRHIVNDLSLHSLLLRQGRISYDYGPKTDRNLVFDPNHFDLYDLSSSIGMTVDHETGIDMNLRRLEFKSHSGLIVDKSRLILHSDANQTRISDIWFHAWLDQDDMTLECSTQQGEAELRGHQLTVNLENLVANGGQDLFLNTSLQLATDMRHLRDADYHANIEESQINPNSISLLHSYLHAEDSPLRDYLHYIDSIGTVSLAGHLGGHGMDSLQWDGICKTSGPIRSEIEGRLQVQQQGGASFQGRGSFQHLPFRSHNYEWISLNGYASADSLNLDVTCDDPYCRMVGNLSFNDPGLCRKLSLDADIDRLDLHRIHLTDWQNLQHKTFAGRVKANLNWIGTDPYPMGNAVIDSISVQTSSEKVRLDPIYLMAQEENGTRVAIMRSPFLNMVFTPAAAIGYLPICPEIFKVLDLPGELAQQASFTAEWDSTTNYSNLDINIPYWKDETRQVSAHLLAYGTTEFGSPIPTEMDASLILGYKDVKHTLSGDLNTIIHLDEQWMELQPSLLTIDGHEFQSRGARLEKDDKGIYELSNFSLHDLDQRLEARGFVASDGRADVYLTFDDMETDFFFDMLGKRYLAFGGNAIGNVSIFNDTVLLVETGNLEIKDFSYMGHRLGDASFEGQYNAERDALDLRSEIASGDEHVSVIEGFIKMGRPDSLELMLQMDELPINFVSNWTGSFLQKLDGTASGLAWLYGNTSRLNLKGDPIVDIRNVTNDLLGATFSLHDTIHLVTDPDETHGAIRFHQAHLFDSQGNLAYLDADIRHQHFHDLAYDVDFNLPNNHQGFLVFDKPHQAEGDYYWGQLYGSGQCQITGISGRHRIALQMETEGKSTLNLSPGEENYSDQAYSFLTFRDKNSLWQDNIIHTYNSKIASNNQEDDKSHLEADLQVRMNDRCNIYVQMDPLAEDRLTCRGIGDMSLHYETDQELRLNGEYKISQGVYTVAMKGDFMTKSFQLQNGSTVNFSGSPSEAELDLNAKYSIPSVNLRDLDESFASVASLSRTSLPVDCNLKVNGMLSAPQISFDLEVKNVSDDVQALVHNIIGTPEMLNQEVLYLLLFSKFYTPEYASTSQRQTGSELSSFASASLTSQLNNLLGHMSDNFTLGTNFRSDKGDFSDMEMDLSLSTRLLNDRLILNGNFGYRDPANRIGMNQNSTSFIGDFDAEYLINSSGTVRAKAYSHYNERDYSINNALTTQGVGIVLRKDFSKFSDIFKSHVHPLLRPRKE